MAGESNATTASAQAAGASASSRYTLPLFADDDRLYLRTGWIHVDNPLTWVKIHDHATLGVARAVTPHAMMVKAIGPRAWPPGEVDLLGHVF